jgi:PKD repeat protein
MRHALKNKLSALVSITLFFLLFGLQTVAQPTITSVAPTTVCQGDSVTITGTGFSGATSVTIGTLAASSFKVKDDKTIVAHVDVNAQSGSVSVTTSKGSNSKAGLIINVAPQPNLADANLSAFRPFTNCDGNKNYLLTVINTSIPAGGSCDYDIDWGDGTAHFKQKDWAVNSQTSHQYTSQGYFALALTITPANGCKKQKIINFYNGANPLATFSTLLPTTSMCADTTVTFTIGDWFKNTPGTTYTITFDDGSYTKLQNPLNLADTVQWVKHTYTTSSCPKQDFTATLDAENGCYTKEYTQNQIVVRIKPKADFDFQATACINEKVCFTDKTENGYSGAYCDPSTNYVWNFGDGTPVYTGSDAPCHTYAKPGTYKVTLATSNTSCGSDEITKTIIVNPTSPLPVVTSPVTYCQHETPKPLTATGTNLLWYESATGGTGSKTAPTPSTSNPGSTTYYVSQTINGECESPRTAIKVTVNALPSAPTVTSPVQLCKGKTATPLTASGSNLLWYTTETGGTGSSTAPTPSTNTTGTFYYYVSQITNSCEGPRATIEVDVSDIPTVPTVTTPVKYCQNQQASPLTASGTGLLWYTTETGGTGSSSAPTPSTASPATTFYYVSASNYCGESKRVKIEVDVLPGPSATIAYSKNVLCNSPDTNNSNPPLPVTITGDKSGTFSVSPSGLIINPSTGTITPAGAEAATYKITYTIAASGGCSIATATTTITITNTPSATISYPAMCSSDDNAIVSLTGTPGGTFSATAGLSIDASTGSINPSTSTPGKYSVTYIIAPSAPCPGFKTTTDVVITKAPQASISYGVTNLCNVENSAATPNPPVKVKLTGTQGGTFTIAPAPGLNIDASTGTIYPSEATANTYTITYTIAVAGGCSVYQTSTQITINSTPTATINYPPICSSDGLTNVTLTGTQGGAFTSSAGLSIDAATGAINPSLSKPGKYTVKYIIAPSPPCPGFTDSTSVIINESPSITFPVSLQSVCSGVPAIFKPSSTVINTIYNWNVEGELPATVSGKTSGTVTGSNSAISLLFTNTGATSDTIIIAVNPVNPTSDPCSGKPYHLTVIVNPIPLKLKSDTTEFCMHAPPMALTANADANNTIKWYDENNVLLNQPPVISTTNPAQFNFYATQTNMYGCESAPEKFIAIVHPVAKIIGSSYTNPISCGIPSGSVTLNVVDLNGNTMPNLPVHVHYTKFQTGYNVADSTDASGKIIIPLTAGTYSDFYVETFGCLSQKIPDVFILKDPTPPVQPIAGYNAPLCSESVFNLSASSPTSSQTGAINYVWVGPAFGNTPDTSQNTTVSFPSAKTSYNGIYIVYAIQNNCISTATSFPVEIKQSPTKPTIATRTPLCIGDNLSLTATSSIIGNNTLNYVWNGPGAGFPVNSANASITNVKVEDGGVYSITVTSPETGCSTTADTLIQIGGYPIVKFSKDSFNVPTGYTMHITPAILNATDKNILPIAKYEWSPPDNVQCNDSACSLPTVIVKKNICYTVKATNIYGCSGSDTICISTFCNNTQVFIPNAFTPRGAAVNAKFMIRASGIASIKSFRVFNRWGRIVFEKNNFPPNDPAYAWDGYVNGKLADMGVYVYTVDVVCENGTPYTYKGNVTLLQ